MDDVVCTGSESSLLDCHYDPDDNCGTGEAAGVICAVEIESVSPGTPIVPVRLEGGSGPHEGNLMVQLPTGEWGPVCDDTFNDQDESSLRKVLN